MKRNVVNVEYTVNKLGQPEYQMSYILSRSIGWPQEQMNGSNLLVVVAALCLYLRRPIELNKLIYINRMTPHICCGYTFGMLYKHNATKQIYYKIHDTYAR